ncbi:MAG TPA: class I SAM-dependent methyltransferase [Elusimicrobiales bacterium]|nr:class I SAM-dependent methyltransferase [Elusimicrobiales bacterium]
MQERSFSIQELWAAGIWRPAIPALLLLAGAFFLIIPARLAPGPRAGAALALGAVSVCALMYRQKRLHLARHISEAVFLGFHCVKKGRLWDPFSPLELVLTKPEGPEEEDTILADLVRMHGPNYVLLGTKPSFGADIALLAGGLAWLAATGARHPLTPLFGIAALFLLLSEAELYFARYEARRSVHESRAFNAPGADYLEWNFLSLEAKRIAAGRVREMERDIRRILLDKAALAGGARILEAGAGGGFLWKHAPPELRTDWTQVEKNPHAVLYAGRHGNGALFCRSDIKALPFPDGCLDAVVGLECFDALASDSLIAFLSEAKRLLKPDGRLIHLKDFPDWPDAVLTGKFRRFTLKVLNRELVGSDRKRRLVFKPLSPEETAALSAAALKEPPADRPYAKTLAAMYSSGIGSDRRFRVPMLVSMMALKEFLTDAGFRTAADSLSDAAGGKAAVAYLIARKA